MVNNPADVALSKTNTIRPIIFIALRYTDQYCENIFLDSLLGTSVDQT